MRKVKKNWVVLSLSFFGAVSVGNVINHDYVAHADTTQTDTTQTNSNAVHTNTTSGTADNSAKNTETPSTAATPSSELTKSSDTASNAVSTQSPTASSADPSTTPSAATTPSDTTTKSNASSAAPDSSIPSAPSIVVNTLPRQKAVGLINDSSVANVTFTNSMPSAQTNIYTSSNNDGVGLSPFNYWLPQKPVYPQYVTINYAFVNGAHKFDTSNLKYSSVDTNILNINNTFTPDSNSSFIDVENDSYGSTQIKFLANKFFNNGEPLSSEKLQFGDNAFFNFLNELDVNNADGMGTNFNVMSIPVIKVNYVDDKNNVISSGYLKADNIAANKSFSTDIALPMNYLYDNSRDVSYSNNYKIINYDSGTNYSNSGAVSGNTSSNDSNLQISNINKNSVTLTGTFTVFKSDTDNDTTDSSNYVGDDWLVDSINIPIKPLYIDGSSDDGSDNGSDDSSDTNPSTSDNPSDTNQTSSTTPSSTNPTSSATPTNTNPTNSTAPSNTTPNSSYTSTTPVTTTTYSVTTSSVGSDAPLIFYSAKSSATSSASSSAATNTASSSSAATSSSAVNNYRKMYNNKTKLVQQDGQIQIYIEPKYAADSANGSLANQYVVTRTTSDGKVVHDQSVTLDQYNAMLSASGKQPFTNDTLDQAYQKRQYYQGIMRNHSNKTTFDAKTVNQGNDTLIDVSGDNYGFNQPADKQLVLDTDDLRVPVHNTKPKKERKIKVKSHHHAKKMKHMKMTHHMNHKHHASHK